MLITFWTTVAVCILVCRPFAINERLPTVIPVAEEKSEASRAESRAIFAWNEGKKEVAAEEWRKVLAIRNMEFVGIKKLRDAGIIEDTGQIELARVKISLAKASLAECEGNEQIGRAEFQKVIDYCEGQLPQIDRFEQMGSISTNEATKAKISLRTKIANLRLRQKVMMKSK